MQEELKQLEEKYRKLYDPLYAKRADIVNGKTDVEHPAEEKEKDDKGARAAAPRAPLRPSGAAAPAPPPSACAPTSRRHSAAARASRSLPPSAPAPPPATSTRIFPSHHLG